MRARSENIYTQRTRRVKESLVTEKTPQVGSARHRLFDNLASEGCADFYNYIDWLDLSAIKETIIIPRQNHFYFTEEDFDGIETVVNLKCLNKVEGLGDFLSTLYEQIPENCYLTACFQESDKINSEEPDYRKYLNVTNGSSTKSWFSLSLGRLFNSDIFNVLSRQSVSAILREVGFTVLDMTELNGRTYFCAQKRSASFN